MTQSIQETSPTKYRCMVVCICIYRILNALLIRTQFDPDEYHQVLEPAYCSSFGGQYNCAYTWEWTRRWQSTGNFLQSLVWGPVRSYFNILPTWALYTLSQRLGLDWNWVVRRGPLILNALIVAAPTDLAVFHMGAASGRGYWALVGSITSWFHGYALVRTYSNSFECMLLSVGLALLAPELFGSKVSRSKASIAFILSGVSITIRFSSIAAWGPIVIAFCFQRPTFLERWRCLFHPCASFALVGMGIGCLVDYYFYGFWVLPFLANFHFNVILGHSSLYGTHPFYWYFMAGFPAITGILLPFFLFQLHLTFCTKSSDQRYQSQLLLFIIIFSYIIIHSLSSHKEFRFILPILPLVCVLAGQAIHTFITTSSHRKRTMLIAFLLFVSNYPHLLFLSLVHQRASLSVNEVIVHMIQQREHTIQKHVGSNDTHAISNRSRYLIHYLLDCHSTPLYSHLHIPFVVIDAWSLDCSPSCRSDPNAICESELFQSNPVEFVLSSYGLFEGRTTGEQKNSDDSRGVCTTSLQDTLNDGCIHKPFPDFLIIHEQNLHKVRQLLKTMALRKVARLPHTVNQVQFHNLFQKNRGFHRLFDVQFDHLVVFASAIRFVD